MRVFPMERAYINSICTVQCSEKRNMDVRLPRSIEDTIILSIPYSSTTTIYSSGVVCLLSLLLDQSGKINKENVGHGREWKKIETEKGRMLLLLRSIKSLVSALRCCLVSLPRLYYCTYKYTVV